MDLIDKRDEVLRIFLEYGITENTENDLTKKDFAECAEQIVKKLTIHSVVDSSVTISKQEYDALKRDSEDLRKIDFSM